MKGGGKGNAMQELKRIEQQREERRKQMEDLKREKE